MKLFPGFLRRRKAPREPRATGVDIAHPLSADRPITSPSEDRLRRTGFASRLADGIAAWHGRDSLVIGLYGQWGSGKTSIIHLAVERLHALEDAPKVIEFNPWEWSGHEELARALFTELAAAVEGDKSRAATDLANRIRAYASVLNAARSLARSLAQGIAALGTILATIGIAVSQFGSAAATWAGITGAVIGGVGIVMSQVQGFTEGLAAVLEKRPIRGQPLAEVKKNLGEALQDYDHTLVIVVDDIDRLAPSETIRMLQIVKANADLPNIVFVLAFDPGAVARGIRSALRVDGRAYLEKIVQASFDVPALDLADFERMLAAGIERAIAPVAIQHRFVADRWGVLYASAVLPLFCTPRDVIRFCSMLEFDLNGQVRGGECDVDPVDFIGIEALRHFERTVYQAVQASKEVLTGSAALNDLTGARRNEIDSRVHEILKLASPNRDAATRQILEQLFPVVGAVLAGMGIYFDRGRRTAERRVSDPASFDYYFQLDVPSGDVSAEELRRTVTTVHDGPVALTAALRGLLVRGLIRSFLLRVRADTNLVPAGSEGAFIAALFSIGDELEGSAEHTDLFTLAESLLACFLIEELLERLPAAEREGVLREAIEASDAAFLPGYVLSLQEHRTESNRQARIDAEAVAKLAPLIVSRIARMAGDGRLEPSRHLDSLLSDWDRWGAHEEVAAWVEQLSCTPAGLGRLGYAFRRSVRDGGEHGLATFMDIPEAMKRAKAWLAGEKLSSDERQLVEDFLARVDFLAQVQPPNSV